MRREDIFEESRVSQRCQPKAKLFVAQLLQIAMDIAPMMSKAKECLDEWDYRPSDHTRTRAERQMLYFAQKIQKTLKDLEDVYEKSAKGVKTIFNREVMMELFLSMLQEFVVDCHNNTGIV